MPTDEQRDTFFWLGQINKATAVVNTSEGLLDPTLAPGICRGLLTVLNAGQAGGPRPRRVIDFEPILIEAAGVEATLLHAGRSSQDMHTTSTTAQLREETLQLGKQLAAFVQALTNLAEAHTDTLVPNYTNGVAAQPNSYGHYLLGHAAGFMRDADRLREFYARLDLSPMGTTVLNGTGWPLNRERMASYLGFSAPVDNAYDAVQIRNAELPVELGSLGAGIALHIGTLIQDIMTQYAQPRPWILLREGGENTYVSSAMPQKRNPGILNNARAEASRIVTLGIGRAIQAHNVPSGMIDSRSIADNKAVLRGAAGLLLDSQKILGALEINPARALEELNLDWTASQELADVLMLEYKIPFRVGHHFASEVVGFAKRQDIKPSDFRYEDAGRIYIETCAEMGLGEDMALPLTQERFRAALDPAAIVRNRKTTGGPQPAEMRRMLASSRSRVAELLAWVDAKQRYIADAMQRLEIDFAKLVDA